MNNNESVFNIVKDRYNHNTINIFECMSTYFTKMFYDHLYRQSINLKDDHSMENIDSITKGYKHVLRQYAKAINTGKFYKESIKGIIIELQVDYTCTLSYSDAITMVIQQFLPEDWPITPGDEDRILRKIFRRSVEDIIYKVTCKFIPMIIDDRNSYTISCLQDEFLNVFLNQKEYTESELNILRRKSHVEDKVNAETFGRFKNEFKRLLDKHAELEAVVVQLQKVIQNMDDERNKLTVYNKELKLEVDDLGIKYRNASQYKDKSFRTNSLPYEESEIPDSSEYKIKEIEDDFVNIPSSYIKPSMAQNEFPSINTSFKNSSDQIFSSESFQNINQIKKIDEHISEKENNIIMSDVSEYSDDYEDIRNIDQTNDVKDQTNDVREKTNDVREKTNDVRDQTNDVREKTNDDTYSGINMYEEN